MGTKDRTPRNVPSWRSQQAAVRTPRAIIGDDRPVPGRARLLVGGVASNEALARTRLKLALYALADSYEQQRSGPKRRGPKVSRQTLDKLAHRLDRDGLVPNIYPESRPIQVAVKVLKLTPATVQDLMHQLKKLGTDNPRPISLRVRPRLTLSAISCLRRLWIIEHRTILPLSQLRTRIGGLDAAVWVSRALTAEREFHLLAGKAAASESRLEAAAFERAALPPNPYLSKIEAEALLAATANGPHSNELHRARRKIEHLVKLMG